MYEPVVAPILPISIIAGAIGLLLIAYNIRKILGKDDDE